MISQVLLPGDLDLGIIFKGNLDAVIKGELLRLGLTDVDRQKTEQTDSQKKPDRKIAHFRFLSIRSVLTYRDQ